MVWALVFDVHLKSFLGAGTILATSRALRPVKSHNGSLLGNLFRVQTGRVNIVSLLLRTSRCSIFLTRLFEWLAFCYTSLVTKRKSWDIFDPSFPLNAICCYFYYIIPFADHTFEKPSCCMRSDSIGPYLSKK